VTSEALREAWEIQRKASAVGFDWSDVKDVIAKVREEVAEIEEALAREDGEHAKREVGDLLFTGVNLARFVDADAVEELRRANERFRSRFAKVEEAIQQSGRSMVECTLEELDAMWERVKEK